MEPLAVDIREAARLLSVSPRSIRRYIESGRIRALRIGRRILIPVEGLSELLSPVKREAAVEASTSADGAKK